MAFKTSPFLGSALVGACCTGKPCHRGRCSMGTVGLGLVLCAQWEGMGKTRCSWAHNPVHRLLCWCSCVGKEAPCRTPVLRTVLYSAWLFLNIIPGKFSVSKLVLKKFWFRVGHSYAILRLFPHLPYCAPPGSPRANSQNSIIFSSYLFICYTYFLMECVQHHI